MGRVVLHWALIYMHSEHLFLTKSIHVARNNNNSIYFARVTDVLQLDPDIYKISSGKT
jgi:hypothetical protein